MTNILILGGWADNAFSTFRQLENIPNLNLFVADPWPLSGIAYSRKCKKFYKTPFENDKNYIDYLIKICKKENIDVLLPPTQDTIVAISKAKQRFLKEGVQLSVPDYKLLDITIDKVKLAEFAKKHHVPTPEPYSLGDYSIEKLDKQLQYPLIIKQKAGTGQKGQAIVNNIREFKSHINKLPFKPSDLIVQEYIPPRPIDIGYNYFTTGLLYDRKHKLKFVVPTRKIREEIPTQGGSAICVRTERNQQVIDLCSKLMNSFKTWEGISDIEVKIDPRDGKAKLIEINPRMWGLDYALFAAGINIAGLWVKTALKQDFAPITDFKEEVYITYVWRDVLFFCYLLHKLFSKDSKLALRKLASFKYPYFKRNHQYPISPDFRIFDIRPMLINLYRVRKKYLRAILPKALVGDFYEKI